MNDFDQILTQYRWKLSVIAQLSASMSAHGLADVTPRGHCDTAMQALGTAVGVLIANRIHVTQRRQTILDIKQTMGVSRRMVEAKGRHLDQEKAERAGESQIRFKELQDMRKLEREKSDMETEIVASSRKLSILMDSLNEKSEKLRHLENFDQWFADYSTFDVQSLKEQLAGSRLEKNVWNDPDVDVATEVRKCHPDPDQLVLLRESVARLAQTAHRYRSWHEEEERTKLFHCSRSSEIKRRTELLTATLQRLEEVGQGEGHTNKVPVTAADDHEVQRQHILETILVDGSPPFPPKEMRKRLANQLGEQVMADCDVIPRFKHVLGDLTLALLLDAAGKQKSPTVESEQKEPTESIESDRDAHRETGDQTNKCSRNNDITDMASLTHGSRAHNDPRPSPWIDASSDSRVTGRADLTRRQGNTCGVKTGVRRGLGPRQECGKGGQSVSRWRKLFWL